MNDSADLCFKINKFVLLFICVKFWVTWASGRKIYTVPDSPVNSNNVKKLQKETVIQNLVTQCMIEDYRAV